MQKVLILDNYDSFTYNLYHYIESMDGVEVDVYRNDEIKSSFAKSYDTLIFSPGPVLSGQTLDWCSHAYWLWWNFAFGIPLNEGWGLDVTGSANCWSLSKLGQGLRG